MYHYLDDKEYLHKMKALCGKIMQDFCHVLKEKYDIGAIFYLVGSGARNLILQNSTEPIDLDYNLEIVRCENFEDCHYIKECARKAFNIALNNHCWSDCEDSTSSLTTKKCYFTTGNQTEFSIDVCITKRDTPKGNYYRLIHEKTCYDKYYWNKAPQSKSLNKKVDYIKEHGKWESVRKQYLGIKNKYLTQNDYNHPSFICYIEAVNNVYNSRNNW